MGRNLIEENGKFAVQSSVDDETILTPWFDSKEDIVQHLVKHGDNNDETPVPEAYARGFVKDGHVPSMVISEGKLYSNYWTLEAFSPKKEP